MLVKRSRPSTTSLCSMPSVERTYQRGLTRSFRRRTRRTSLLVSHYTYCLVFFVCCCSKMIAVSNSLLITRQRVSLVTRRASISSLADMAGTCCEQIFDLQLPEGRCLAIQLKQEQAEEDFSLPALSDPNHWIYGRLHAKEIDYALAQPSENIRRCFLLGRLAIREAIPQLSRNDCILKDEYGRPNMPRGYLGSISHKGSTAVALVTECEDIPVPTYGIGVDLEDATANKGNIARKVLTPNEIRSLGRVKGLSADEEVLLRFSLKESVYKAMHPLICQYVGFQEAEVHPQSDGRAQVLFNLKSGAHQDFGTVTCHWQKVDSFFLSSSSVRLKEAPPEVCSVE